MNWFSEYFQQVLVTKSGGLYGIGFFTESLLYVLLCYVIFLFFKKRFGLKSFFISTMAGFALWLLEPLPEMPLEGLTENYRLATLSSDTTTYIIMMLVGLLSLPLAFFKKTRSLHRVASSVSLSVLMILLYGYHVVMINGNLRANLWTLENSAKQYVMLSDTGYAEICTNMNMFCQSGLKQDRYDLQLKEVERNVNDHMGFYRSNNTKNILFTDSNALITSNTPYVLAYREIGERYRLVINLDDARTLFDSSRIQFYLFANTAVLFWFFGALLMVGSHEWMFYKRSRAKNHYEA